MATNLFAGRQAKLLVSAASSAAGAVIGSVRNFKLDVKRDVIDATSFDSSGWEQKLSGLASWQLQSEALILSTAGSLYANQLRVRTALSSGVRQYWQIENSTAAGTQAGQLWKGFGFATNWTLGGDVKDIQLLNFSVVGDGKLTEA